MHIMYDSVDLTQIPASSSAVAGYVGGIYPTDSHGALREKFPHSYVASIAVQRAQRASFADVENGDLEVLEGVPWIEEGLALGEERPGLYAAFANMVTLVQELRAAKIPRWEYRLWLATDDGLADAINILEHGTHLGLPLPEGFSVGGVQYDWHALNRDLDASLVRPGFFTTAEHPLDHAAPMKLFVPGAAPQAMPATGSAVQPH